MRTILTALFLYFAILLGIAESASGASTVHGSKTAYGDFWENPNICTYKLGSLELEPCRGDTIVGYDSATGVLYYVRQNPWTHFDPHGLWLFGYDTAGEYFHEVGQVWVGYGDSIASTATGTWEAVTNPSQTWEGIKAVANDPGGAAKGAWEGVKQAGEDLASGDSRKQGNVVGGILQAAIPASKVKALSKLPGGKKKGGGREGTDPSNGAGPSGTGCFAKGTPVATPHGIVPIEDLEVGDIVLARDEETATVTERRVTEVVQNATLWWAEITVKGETIKATRRHRFWSKSANEWKYAKELHKGELVILKSGEVAEVENINLTECVTPEATFNLEVEIDHVFYVGKVGVLVHNGDIDDEIFERPDDLPGKDVDGMDSDHRIPKSRDKTNQTLQKSKFNRQQMVSGTNRFDKRRVDMELVADHKKLIQDLIDEGVPPDQARKMAQKADRTAFRANATSIPAHPTDVDKLCPK